MKTINSFLISIVLVLAAAAIGLYVYHLEAPKPEPVPSYSGYSAQLNSMVASTSKIIVGIQGNKAVFTKKDNCAARIIGTAGQPIMISFASGTPNGATGFVQAASTTVSYDSNFFGCDTVIVYGQVASTTITTQENAW